MFFLSLVHEVCETFFFFFFLIKIDYYIDYTITCILVNAAYLSSLICRFEEGSEGM